MTNATDGTPGFRKPFGDTNLSPETGEKELEVIFALKSHYWGWGSGIAGKSACFASMET